MKKFTALLLSIFFLFSAGTMCCPSAVGNSESDEQIYKYNGFKYALLDDGTAELRGYTGSKTSVNIPSTLGSVTVTSIGNEAFYMSAVEEVTVPSAVTSIGWWAFYGCENLKSVTLHYGLKSICYGAFMNCPNLTSITLPVTVTSIGDDSFAVSCSASLGVYDEYSGGMASVQNYSVNNACEISGYSGTAAEKYAAVNSLGFNSLGEIVYGDLNGSKTVDAADAEIAAEIADGLTAADNMQAAAADVDNDGEITDDDAALIAEAAENGGAENFPVQKAFNGEESRLRGKSMYCDGDSVAHGTGTAIFGSSYYSFCSYAAGTLGMSIENRAVGGTTIARRKEYDGTAGKSILERVREMSGNYDVILLEGGFNDLFKKVEIGEMTPASDKSGNYDEYTTAGALESICYFITENYPNAIKLFVLGHKMYNYDRQSEYWNLIKQILDKWNIPYVDISEECGLSDGYAELTAQYFCYNSSSGSGDGIHPTAYAHRKIYGTVVARRLNAIAKAQKELILSKTDITLGAFETTEVSAKAADSSSDGQISWSSDNDTVASVDENGCITANCPGKATITAEDAFGRTADVTVAVMAAAMSLRLNAYTLSLGVNDLYTLEATVPGGEASLNKTFCSSNPSVASVNEKTGLVTAVGRGTAVITVRTSCGVVARCTVTVEGQDIRGQSEIF